MITHKSFVYWRIVHKEKSPKIIRGSTKTTVPWYNLDETDK